MGRVRTYGVYKRRRQQRERWAQKYERERVSRKPFSPGLFVFILFLFLALWAGGVFGWLLAGIGAACGLTIALVRSSQRDQKKQEHEEHIADLERQRREREDLELERWRAEKAAAEEAAYRRFIEQDRLAQAGLAERPDWPPKL